MGMIGLRRVTIAALAALLAVLAAACGASGGDTAKTTAASKGAAVDKLISQGITQAEAHRWTQAVDTFENVLLLSPGNHYALYNLGVIDQERHRLRSAIARYNQALKSDSTYTPAMYNEALILEGTNRGAALALYLKIVALNPKASTAFLRMAMLYSEFGETAAAAQARAKAIALDPSLAKYPLPGPCKKTSC